MYPSGPNPVQPVQSIPAQALQLRLNQRITAEVLNLSETQAVLSVGGRPLAARLETPEQAARLAELVSGGQPAHFSVVDLTDGTVLLKLIGTEAPAGDLSVDRSVKPEEILTRLLDQMGREATQANLTIARALAGQIPVTPAWLDQLQVFLDGLGRWGAAEAAAATAILSAGLPLTPDVYQAITALPDQAGKMLVDLFGLLQSAAQREDLPPGLRQAIHDSLAALEKGVLNWSETAGLAPERLRASIDLLGRSLENALHPLKPGQTEPGASGLLSLARLVTLSKEGGERALAEKTQELLNQLEKSQLTNLRVERAPGQGEWCNIPLVLQNETGKQPEFSFARLRIARREDGLDPPVDADSTRLIIQVELSPGEEIAVDLALVNCQISARITTSTQGLQERSQEELDSLNEGLRRLGYRLLQPQFIVGEADMPGSVAKGNLAGPHFVVQRVNLEV